MSAPPPPADEAVRLARSLQRVARAYARLAGEDEAAMLLAALARTHQLAAVPPLYRKGWRR